MSSTSTTATIRDDLQKATPEGLRWRRWPLAEHPHWSWLVPLGILAVGAGLAAYGGRLIGLAAAAALTAALWQFLLPVTYEVDARGLRRRALGRTRYLPWRSVRAYQPRATGIVLFPSPDPTPIDALRSIFVPYAPDADETLCAIRPCLSHADEL